MQHLSIFDDPVTSWAAPQSTARGQSVYDRAARCADLHPTREMREDPCIFRVWGLGGQGFDLPPPLSSSGGVSTVKWSGCRPTKIRSAQVVGAVTLADEEDAAAPEPPPFSTDGSGAPAPVWADGGGLNRPLNPQQPPAAVTTTKPGSPPAAAAACNGGGEAGPASVERDYPRWLAAAKPLWRQKRDGRQTREKTAWSCADLSPANK